MDPRGDTPDSIAYLLSRRSVCFGDNTFANFAHVLHPHDMGAGHVHTMCMVCIHGI